MSSKISIRPLVERDLAAADDVMRLAFGTFLGLPEPRSFLGDGDFVRTRWRANSNAAFAAEIDSELAGSNFATRWGSVGFFGPLTIRPDLWDRGVGKRLMEPILDCFERWGTTHAGLFTFAQSEKHVGLYRKYGFWPRFLTAVMSKEIQPRMRPSAPASRWTRFSELSSGEQDEALALCRELTGAVYDGLDVGSEVRAVAAQQLGETLLLYGGDKLAGFAVCHHGPGTEAGSGVCFVKFGAARPSSSAGEDFERLLSACEEMAAEKGLAELRAGVSTARHEAYRQMLARGFRTIIQGVAMHRPNEAGYHRPGVYVVDDWR